MPIKIKLAIREGWRASENARFGEVFEIQFIDADSGLIMWRYAPRLGDEAILADAFRTLREYDGKLKELRAIIARVENVPQIDKGVRQGPAACGVGGIRGPEQSGPAQLERKATP